MADRNIRVLFWQPNPVNGGNQDFADCLQILSEQENLIDYTECAGGLRIRAERLDYADLFWRGDFVRQQVDNVPPIAPEAQPLQANPNPIGHRAAFLYSVEHNVLAIQSARPGVSAAAVNSYIRRRIHAHRGFFLDPCLSSDALARIREGSPRKVEMRVARPADLAHIDPDFNAVEDSLSALQQFVDGHVVELSVGFERSEREALLNRERLLGLFRWAAGNRNHVKKFKIKIEEEGEAIDMFAERLDHRGSVRLDPNDLDAAYQARIDFVRDAFDANRQELDDLYVAQ